MEYGAGLTLAVTSAAEAAGRDRAAIEGGIDSFDLMWRAGSVAAAIVQREFGDLLSHGVALYAGRGNNGGDAYVVAEQLAQAGITVRLHATAPPATPDAQRAAQQAASALTHGEPTGSERLIIDGLLGTGHRGALRGDVAAACRHMDRARCAGARIVALDLPSGLDATGGEAAEGIVPADCTVTFGTIKRGLLLNRAVAGRILMADIGLGEHGTINGRDDAWQYLAPAACGQRLPAIAWNAHKGTRGRVAIVGGERGMAGAVAWAAHGALRSGAGLVRAVVEEASIAAMQSLVPQATARSWESFRAGDIPDDGSDDLVPEPIDALAIGPGLGRTDYAFALLERLVWSYRTTPIVLDADALALIAFGAQARGDSAATLLASWSQSHPGIVCTPHPKEFARLLDAPVPTAWDERAARARQFAREAGVTLLLKGTPTLVAAPVDAPLTVVPHGTPILATGGSGDLLTGTIAALLAQQVPPADAAIIGATVHGLAAEIATSRLGGVRGGVLDDVVAAYPAAWRQIEQPAELPADLLARIR